MNFRSKMTRPNTNKETGQEKQPAITKAVASAESSEVQDMSTKSKKAKLSGNQEIPPTSNAIRQTKKFVPPLSIRSRNPRTTPSNIDFPLHLEPTTLRLSSMAKNPIRSTPTESQTTNNTRIPLSSKTLTPSIEVSQNLPQEVNVVEDVGEDDVREDDVAEDDVAEDEVAEHGAGPSKLKKKKRARNMKTLEWTGPENIDAKEDVLVIDSKNNKKILNGTIHPLEIDNLEDGVRLVVNFSDLNQPLRRGGDVLVKYLNYVSKQERHCPIGVLNWHKMADLYKTAIVKKVRGKFVIPPGELFDKAILGRVNKYWKHYKYTLKSRKFNPDTRTRKQILDDAPYGIPPQSWKNLVEYWYTDKSKNLSSAGKVARTTQSHVHTTGRVSFANTKVDVVESTGKHPSQLEFFKITHTTIGGGFVENTSSSQFLEVANSKVNELVNTSSKSRVEIENEVFDEIMYADENTKRVVGYGFGVRKSQVMGVHAKLRTSDKPASTTNSSTEIELVNAKMSSLNEEYQASKKENQVLRSMVLQNNKILFQTIEAMRTGNVSSELCESLQSALPIPNYEGTSVANGNDARSESDDLPSLTPSI